MGQLLFRKARRIFTAILIRLCVVSFFPKRPFPGGTISPICDTRNPVLLCALGQLSIALHSHVHPLLSGVNGLFYILADAKNHSDPSASLSQYLIFHYGRRDPL